MIVRTLKHLSSPGWWARRVFRDDDLAAIKAAVAASEQVQRGEIRIAIEGSLPLGALLVGQSTRQRAERLFQELGVYDTREANGILIYVQLVDRQVEIVTGRGIAAVVQPSEWQTVCATMEQAFMAGNYRDGMLTAIARTTELLALPFPAIAGNNPNELSDTPFLL